ncbi:hypothetical protein ACQCSX_22005 (plasmid) [Pseudarthrobacter sp. P1]|uniref:hypothetical protein n=1 Tax=Pseudarthrobacter sp. P1 TaxID=3418418 RepID=UPI003CE886C8
MPHDMTTRDDWEAQPVGTIARVEHLSSREEGGPVLVAFVTRVDGDFQSTAGQYQLAGGRHWSGIWDHQRRATVLNAATVPAAPVDAPTDAPVRPSSRDGVIAAATDAIDNAITQHHQVLDGFLQTPYREYVKIPAAEHPASSPAGHIIDQLLQLGWQPPEKVADGVQVWTISGTPATTIRSDGTMVYLSLPARTDSDRFAYQDRGDIWLENPVITVNFELPSRTD